MLNTTKLLVLIVIIVIAMPNAIGRRVSLCNQKCKKFWHCLLEGEPDCDNYKGQCECKTEPT
ncbi:unnamed protein product [Brugia pahangi]|uniref:UPF0506 domain-containing protein n=1 Tax=Brugia pahangi TaxID=6280 RepID=A0A0N4T565_BRUPA|nr:unnamed protein product [Brugia pahangi]